MVRRMTILTVALALAGAGCTREPEVEKVAVGSDVQLTRQDGGVVQGTLTAKDEKTVQVQSGKSTKTVPKDQIADVKVVAKDAAEPPKLPPVAKFREITVPEGTKLAIELETPLNTKTATVEQPVNGRLTEAVTIDGMEVLPVGSKVHGNVSAVTPAGKVKGVASITVRFNRLNARDESYQILSDFSLTAPSSKKKDAAKIGIGAAAGAVIGAIAGGGKGAAIGAIIGAGAGVGSVYVQGDKDLILEPGAQMIVRIYYPAR